MLVILIPLLKSWIPAPVPSSSAASARAAQHFLSGLCLLMGTGDREKSSLQSQAGLCDH